MSEHHVPGTLTPLGSSTAISAVASIWGYGNGEHRTVADISASRGPLFDAVQKYGVVSAYMLVQKATTGEGGQCMQR